ncbi:MAG TPA: hypothetical protein VMR34_01050 [Candidatus Saccharimonadales bacterium]|nr:hypothetical protein [Candidatus Saccharimonadales bacterium]
MINSKLRQYTLTNDKGDKYSILFYKGSSTQSYNFGTVTDNVLVSPPISKGGVSLVMSLSGRPNNSTQSAQQLVENSNNCSSSSNTENVQAFSVFIKSIGVNANFCTNPSQYSVSPVEFNSFFGNSTTVYAINIAPYSPGQQVNTSNEAAIQATKPNPNDIKTIAASFKYLGSN